MINHIFNILNLLHSIIIMEHLITCPITKCIMKNPVTAADGFTYEKQAIQKWFMNHDKSPMTNKLINKRIIESITMKQIIEEYITANPNKKPDEYKEDFDNEFFIHMLKQFESEDSVYEYISKFTNISINFTNVPDSYELFKSFKIMTHIIDNIDDIEKIYVSTTCKSHVKLISLLCLYSTTKIINYTLSKYNNLDLEHVDEEGWAPIHCAAAKSSPEIIKLLISLKVNISEFVTIAKTQELVEAPNIITTIGKRKDLTYVQKLDIFSINNNITSTTIN